MLRDGLDRHRGRDPRPRARQARQPPRALARAARGAGRPAGPAHRPLGHAEAARRGRAASSSAPGRECALVDAGTFRELDLGIEVPPSPLSTVCSHEQWEEIYARMAELVREHRTTLVFVNTRKMAERIAGPADAAPRRRGRHEPPRQPLAGPPPGRRAAAEGRQAPRARRDRVARARHRHRRRGPRHPGRRHALDRDVPAARRARGPRPDADPEGTALPADARRARRGGRAPALHPRVDSRPHAAAAAAARHPRAADRRGLRRRAVGRREPLRRLRGARGPTAISRASEFDGVVALHTAGPPGAAPPRRRRRAPDGHAARAAHGAPLRRRDPRHRRLPGAPGARGHARRHRQRGLGGRVERRRHLPARQRLLARPARRARHRARRRREGRSRRRSRSGSARRRAARASSRPRSARCARSARPAEGEAAGFLAQVGCGRRALPPGRRPPDRGVRRGGASASSAPCPRRSASSSSASSTRAAGCSSSCTRPSGRASTAPGASRCASASASASASSCRRPPTKRRSSSRSGRSTASRSRTSSTTCTRTPAREVLVQAVLAAPLFETRWRWNAQRSLLLERSRSGKKVPAPLLRMRANDLLVAAFPAGAGVPGDAAGRPDRGPDGPSRSCAQTIEDCLTEAMDVEGFLEVLRGLQRRLDRAARRRHGRALGLRARHPRLAALHASSTTRRSRSGARRRSSRGACSTRRPPTRSARSIPRRSRGSAKRRGRSPRTPRRSTRRSSGWAT